MFELNSHFLFHCRNHIVWLGSLESSRSSNVLICFSIRYVHWQFVTTSARLVHIAIPIPSLSHRIFWSKKLSLNIFSIFGCIKWSFSSKLAHHNIGVPRKDKIRQVSESENWPLGSTKFSQTMKIFISLHGAWPHHNSTTPQLTRLYHKPRYHKSPYHNLTYYTTTHHTTTQHTPFNIDMCTIFGHFLAHLISLSDVLLLSKVRNF